VVVTVVILISVHARTVEGEDDEELSDEGDEDRELAGHFTSTFGSSVVKVSVLVDSFKRHCPRQSVS
jgi:hypothetical protein